MVGLDEMTNNYLANVYEAKGEETLDENEYAIAIEPDAADGKRFSWKWLKKTPPKSLLTLMRADPKGCALAFKEAVLDAGSTGTKIKRVSIEAAGVVIYIITPYTFEKTTYEILQKIVNSTAPPMLPQDPMSKAIGDVCRVS